MTNTYDSENNRDRADARTDRYVDYEVGDGETVVFDTRNPDAWLRSDAAVAVEDLA
ncbi:DUF7331 family protein [Halorussus halobius]|uniref:DUF7331 family protein n=1 Tax=Halorussus halobius TaxID=1710537 RepID=UPI00143DFDCC|nr:hypothetical protein [Halorussus halobius]